MHLSSTTNFWRATFQDYTKYANLKTVTLPDCTMLIGQLKEGDPYVPINAMFPKDKYKLYQAQIKAYYYQKMFEVKV